MTLILCKNNGTQVEVNYDDIKNYLDNNQKLEIFYANKSIIYLRVKIDWIGG